MPFLKILYFWDIYVADTLPTKRGLRAFPYVQKLCSTANPLDREWRFQ